jgi:hypothetical protein
LRGISVIFHLFLPYPFSFPFLFFLFFFSFFLLSISAAHDLFFLLFSFVLPSAQATQRENEREIVSLRDSEMRREIEKERETVRRGDGGPDQWVVVGGSATVEPDDGDDGDSIPGGQKPISGKPVTRNPPDPSRDL